MAGFNMKSAPVSFWNTFTPLSKDIYGDEWFIEQGTADKRG